MSVALAERQETAVFGETADTDLRAGKYVTFTDEELTAFEDMETADIRAFVEKRRKECGF